MRVLIIEDDHDLGQLIRTVLDRNGCQSSVAASMAEARHFIGSEHFDVLVVDLVLPDGNGLDLLDDLVGGLNQDSVVVVSSGNVTPSLRTDPRIGGVFQKPYDINSLLRFIRVA